MRRRLTERILVVDDEPDSQRALVGMLQRRGHTADAVGSGEAALERIAAQPEAYDIILVDQVLYAGIDGFQVLRQIKSDYPALAVVLFTGHGDVASGVEALRLGAYRYLFKPVEPNELDLVLHSIREVEGLRQEKEWLGNLLPISNVMLGARDLGQVLQTIAEAVQRMLGFGRVAVSLVEKDMVRVHAVVGLTADEAKALLGRTYPRDVFFRPMQERFQISRSYFIPARDFNWREDYGDFFIDRDLGARAEGEWQSGDLLRVPIHAPDGSAVGIISVEDPEDRRRPALETVRAVELLAGQAALAIDNARLFQAERRRREIADTLSKIPQIINGTLELEKVLDLILDQLQRVVAYDSASLQLRRPTLNEQEDILEIIADRGLGPQPNALRGLAFPLDPGHHPNVLVLQEKQRRVVPDVQGVYEGFADPRFHAQHIRGWLGVPLLYRGEAIGVISIDKRDPDFYNDEDAELALTFASQAAIAIANARLFEEADHRSTTLETLLEVGQTLASKATQNPGKVLQVIVEGAARVTGADSVVIYPYNAATQSYERQLIRHVGLRD